MKRRISLALVSLMLLTSLITSPSSQANAPSAVYKDAALPMLTSTPTLTPIYIPSCGFASTLYLIGTETSSIGIGDFNRDGNSDMAIGNTPTSFITLMMGNGDGTFASPSIYQVHGSADALVTADFNHDKATDIVAYSGTTTTLEVIIANGDGTFQPPQSYYIDDNHNDRLLAGDFNGDGNNDILVSTWNYYVPDNLWLLRGNGDGSFQAPLNEGSIIQGTNRVADLNGDGKLDLAAADGVYVKVRLGNGDGSFGAEVSYTTTNTITVLTIADLNHDGKLDIAAIGTYSPQLSVLLGNGDGSFQSPIDSYIGVTYAADAVTADFDGDGNNDIALASYGNVTMLYGDGNARFVHSFSFQVEGYVNGPALADFNNDGSPDLVVNSATYYVGGLVVMMNQCAAAATPTPRATPTYVPQPTVCANPFVDINTNVFFHAINALYCQNVISGFDATHYVPGGTANRGQFAKIVTLAMGIPLTTPSGGPTFSDVPTSSFAYVYVESGYAAHILSGFDAHTCETLGTQFPCYLPSRPITRGQLTKLVVNAAGFALLTPTSGPSFNDVPAQSIFYAYIETAHANHVINGYLDGTFRPNNVIRRDEMAQIVYTAEQARPTPTPTVTGTPPTSTPTPTITSTPTSTPTPTITPTPTATATPNDDCPNPFVDIVENPYYVAIHILYCRGIVEGEADHYYPSVPATRAVASKAIVLGFAIAAFTPSSQNFNDVPPSYPYYTYIETGFHAGVLTGESGATCEAAGTVPPCFLPERAISRGEMAQYTVVAAGYALTTPTLPTYSDVPANNPFYVYVETAHAHNLMAGFADGTFRPDDAVLRDLMADVIYRGLTLP